MSEHPKHPRPSGAMWFTNQMELLRAKREFRRQVREDLHEVLADVALQTAAIVDHDPGDEDSRFEGPWCSRCGDAFDEPERSCPSPAPGRPYVDCGRGGHMFDEPEPRTARGDA